MDKVVRNVLHVLLTCFNYFWNNSSKRTFNYFKKQQFKSGFKVEYRYIVDFILIIGVFSSIKKLLCTMENMKRKHSKPFLKQLTIFYLQYRPYISNLAGSFSKAKRTC